jgi:hypothetical protein
MHEQSINPKNLQGQVKDASLPISGHSVPNVLAQPKQLPSHSFKISLKDKVSVTRTQISTLLVWRYADIHGSPGLVKDIVIVMRGLETLRQTTAAKVGRRGSRKETRHKTREVLVFTWKKKIKATDS